MPDTCLPDHRREHRSLLATAEKRLLTTIARHLPAWITSDHLTVLGLAAMLVAGLAYAAARWNPLALWLVLPALAVNWFGDSLDGTLARVREQLRPRYGFYVDHVVDVVGAFFLLGGLALSGYMTPLLAVGLLAAYLMVAAELFLATHTLGVFRLSFLSIGPTELRLVLGAGTLALFVNPMVELGGRSVLLFDLGGGAAIAGLLVALAVSAARNARALFRAERLS